MSPSLPSLSLLPKGRKAPLPSPHPLFSLPFILFSFVFHTTPGTLLGAGILRQLGQVPSVGVLGSNPPPKLTIVELIRKRILAISQN